MNLSWDTFKLNSSTAFNIGSIPKDYDIANFSDRYISDILAELA